jgi:hypothetical protein
MGDVCFSGELRSSNNSRVKNASSFSTTWSAHDCAECLKIAANLHSSCTGGVRSMDRKLKSAVESIASNCRGVAQPGSAPALGDRRTTFRSTHSIFCFGFYRFQQTGESASRSKANPNGLNLARKCTVRARQRTCSEQFLGIEKVLFDSFQTRKGIDRGCVTPYPCRYWRQRGPCLLRNFGGFES